MSLILGHFRFFPYHLSQMDSLGSRGGLAHSQSEDVKEVGLAEGEVGSRLITPARGGAGEARYGWFALGQWAWPLGPQVKLSLTSGFSGKGHGLEQGQSLGRTDS